MLPSNVRECKIGELTTLGIGQLLKTGLILRNAYYNKLNLSNSTLSSRDVIVYSTRYRRTVQSAIALLYSFLLENEVFQNFGKITMRESSSLTFCNTDCACPTAEKFVKQYSKVNISPYKYQRVLYFSMPFRPLLLEIIAFTKVSFFLRV